MWAFLTRLLSGVPRWVSVVIVLVVLPAFVLTTGWSVYSVTAAMADGREVEAKLLGLHIFARENNCKLVEEAFARMATSLDKANEEWVAAYKAEKDRENHLVDRLHGVSNEHTQVLPDEVRIAIEASRKSSSEVLQITSAKIEAVRKDMDDTIERFCSNERSS